MVAVFAATDVFVFYVAFELMLIPMYFLIGAFGGPNRTQAATKFFIYSLFGGLMMLASVIGLYVVSGDHTADGARTLDWAELRAIADQIPVSTQLWIFAGFAIAFAIKAPLVPLHSWLPDAGAEAPVGSGTLIVGVLDKVGTFGFLRICLPLLPAASAKLAWLIITLAVIGIFYGGLVAAGQRDLKRFVTFTSIAHFGFIAMGVFAFTTQAISGAVFYMVAHGLATGLLFLAVGMLIERGGSRQIADYGGVWKVAPILGGLFLIGSLATIALPGTSSFIAEFLVLLGTFATLPAWAIIATVGIVIAAIYMLWIFQRTMTGPVRGAAVLPDDAPTGPAGGIPAVREPALALTGKATRSRAGQHAAAPETVVADHHVADDQADSEAGPHAVSGKVRARFGDLNKREIAVLTPLVVLILVLGVYPKPVLDVINPTATQIRGRLRPHRPGARDRSWKVNLQVAAAVAPVQDPITGPGIDFVAIMPILILLGGACVGVLIEALFRPRRRYVGQVLLTAVAIIGALAWTIVYGADRHFVVTLGGSLSVDQATYVVWGVVLALGLASVLLMADRVAEPGGAFVAQAAKASVIHARARTATIAPMQTEVFPLALFAMSGMLVFPAAADLPTLFVGLEVLSLPLYLMCGFARRRRLLSQEAAVKYFLLGAFASAILLYGIALLYGYSGSLRLADIALASRGRRPVRRAAPRRHRAARRRTAVQGLRRSVPHLDAGRLPGRADPDHRVHGRLYQGRRVRRDDPGVQRGVRADAVGLAGDALGGGDRVDADRRHPRHHPDRRQADAGLLVGCARRFPAARCDRALPGGDLGDILLSAHLRLRDHRCAGAGHAGPQQRRRGGGGVAVGRPGQAVADAGRADDAVPASFAGIPLTSGFIAKLTLFSAAADAGMGPLVVVAMVATAITAFFYLRIVVLMYFSEPLPAGPAVTVPAPMTLAVIGICGVATLGLGLFPSYVLDLLSVTTPLLS